FSEDVVGFDASKIEVAGGVAGAFNAVNGRTYTLVVTPNTTPNEGNVTVSVAAGAVSDLAGNALADGVSASQAYEFAVAKDEEGKDIVDEQGNTVGQAPEADTTAPTLRITDNVPGVANGPVLFTFSFSEDVVG
ncbi:Ig-like domain-containing protein, partial [Arthrospira platensis SPKY2]